jgi:hypothetical protein
MQKFIAFKCKFYLNYFFFHSANKQGEHTEITYKEIVDMQNGHKKTEEKREKQNFSSGVYMDDGRDDGIDL